NPQPLNSSYVIVNPTMPEVQTHIENVVTDIASKYAIDGLHLDYTRLTNNSNGVNLTYPMDPATVARFQAVYPGQTPAGNQALDRRSNSGIIVCMRTHTQDNPTTAYNNTVAQLNYAKAQGSNGIVMFDYGTLYNSTGTLATAQAEVRRAFTDFYAANGLPPAPSTISNFDVDEGYFPTSITFSGSNQNVAASSSADRVTTEAHTGSGSQQIVINKTPG